MGVNVVQHFDALVGVRNVIIPETGIVYASAGEIQGQVSKYSTTYDHDAVVSEVDQLAVSDLLADCPQALVVYDSHVFAFSSRHIYQLDPTTLELDYTYDSINSAPNWAAAFGTGILHAGPAGWVICSVIDADTADLNQDIQVNIPGFSVLRAGGVKSSYAYLFDGCGQLAVISIASAVVTYHGSILAPNCVGTIRVVFDADAIMVVSTRNRVIRFSLEDPAAPEFLDNTEYDGVSGLACPVDAENDEGDYVIGTKTYLDILEFSQVETYEAMATDDLNGLVAISVGGTFYLKTDYFTEPEGNPYPFRPAPPGVPVPYYLFAGDGAGDDLMMVTDQAANGTVITNPSVGTIVGVTWLEDSDLFLIVDDTGQTYSIDAEGESTALGAATIGANTIRPRSLVNAGFATAFIAGGSVFYSEDDGATWAENDLGGPDLTAIMFASNWYAADETPRILMSATGAGGPFTDDTHASTADVSAMRRWSSGTITALAAKTDGEVEALDTGVWGPVVASGAEPKGQILAALTSGRAWFLGQDSGTNIAGGSYSTDGATWTPESAFSGTLSFVDVAECTHLVNSLAAIRSDGSVWAWNGAIWSAQAGWAASAHGNTDWNCVAARGA